MSKTAHAEWKKLNKSINCRHYIGVRAWSDINDALDLLADPKIKTPVDVAKTPSPAKAAVKPKPKATTSK